MGTTDNNDVVFKRNNVQSGLLDDAGSNTSWGVGALNPPTTGTGNTANGYKALNANTSGGNNVAVGTSALYSNTLGGSNSALGYNAMYSNTQGAFNTACGYSALQGNATGTFNSALGCFSNVSSSALTNTTVIGSFAYATQSNTVVIGSIAGVNAAANSVNVGIGTSAPTALLSVNGTANNPAGAWGVFSDSRVKTVNGDFTDGLNVISKIHTIRFNYKANAPFKADVEQIGVIAQELEQIAPYMVTQKPYGDIKDLREVSNQAYVFLLINAVKEQQAQIEKLKADNKEMSETTQQQIKQLQAEIDALRSATGR
jgi:hypothetical protein